MYMHTYTQTYIYTYTYIYTCTYTRIHAHTYTYTRMHRQKILATTPQRVKQYHRRTYASMCICRHIHTYIHIHICAQPAESVFADVYVGVKTHLCNIHACPCTSAQNTCKVHATLTAKKCTYIYTYTHMCTHTYEHENTCAFMTPSTRWSTDTETHNLCTNMHTHTHTHVYIRIDVQIHTHMHIYTYIHVRTHTHIHIYTHTHIQNMHMNARMHAWNDGAAANARGAVADAASFARLFRLTQSNHILHLQCKDFMVPTSWNTNTPPPSIPSSQHTPEQFADRR